MKKIVIYVLLSLTFFMGSLNTYDASNNNSGSIYYQSSPKDNSNLKDYAILIIYLGMFISGVAVFVKEMPKAKSRKLDAETSTDIFVSEAELLKHLPNFNMKEFTDYVFNTFSKVQTAMSKEDMKSVRNFMSDELYNVYLTQIKLMQDNNQKKVVEDFSLNRVALHRINEVNGKISLTVSLIWNSKDYIVNTKTNEVIRGDKTALYKTRFLLTFVTTKDANTNELICPNCGGKLEINHTGKCKYCEAIVTNTKYNYILTKKQYVSRELIEHENKDIEFSEEEIEGKLENIVMQTLYALSTKNIDNVRHFLSNKVELSLEEKIKEMKKNKHTLILEELQMNYSNLKTKRVVDGKYLVSANVWVKGFIYTVDENKKIIDGNDFKPVTKNITLILEKNINHKQHKSVKRCPHCGNNMNINKSGKCEYCGNIYNLEDYDYIVNEFYLNGLIL